jgi:hypothetical protein
MPTPSIDQLKRALAIAEQIQQLEAELGRIVGDRSSAPSVPKAAAAASPIRRRGKRTMSAEAREKIAAAQRARWAKSKGTATVAAKGPASKPKKKTRKLSPEGRARIVAALKARWAAKKAGK